MAIATASLLNGWDYVLAITEDQINKGLGAAYEGANIGSALPSMPKGEFTLPLDDTGTRQLAATFGRPRIAAQHDALKQCDLLIPLAHASIVEGGHSTKLPPDTCLVITTSLSSTATSVEASSGQSTHHDAFVDFIAPEAIYKVTLQDPAHDELRPRIAAALKRKLRDFHAHAFRVASFEAPAQANPFVPSRVDVCFVHDAGQPGRHAVIFAASLDRTGALQENRLEFKPDILPIDVPAALWVGPRVVQEQLVLPMLRQSMSAGTPPSLRFVESSGEIHLAERYDTGAVGGKTTVLEGLRVFAANGTLVMQSTVRVYNVAKWKNAVVTDTGHIAFGVNADHTTFSATNALDSHAVAIENNAPRWFRWLFGILTLGISEAIEAIENAVVGNRVFKASASTLNQKLQLGAGKVSDVARQIPGFEDLAAGGHLMFDRVVLADGGAAFLGVRATNAAPKP